MTAYNLTADRNIDALSPARTGGDTVGTNGWTLTIDQDTRYGLGGGPTFSLGSMTITAATGGRVLIDGRGCWLLPYTGGSGNVPAYNTVVTQSGQTGSGKLIAVYSALNVTPILPGAPMPASGLIKVKQKTGTYAAGALTGLTATSSGAGTVGFIEVVGDEASTINANRLGVLDILGAWFEVGTTSGSSATTYQMPTNGSIFYCPAIYVDSDSSNVTAASWAGGVATYTIGAHRFVVGDEVTVTGASPAAYNVTDAVITGITDTGYTIAMAVDPTAWVSGGAAKVMEPYTTAGSLVAAASTPTDAIRGKRCWITTAGVLRLGSDGTNTVGYVPPAGRRIRIPNVLLMNCSTASRTVNILPSATLATRYDFTTTGGGVVNIDKAVVNWYPSMVQAFSVNMKYAAVAEQFTIMECTTAPNIVRVGVGQSAAQANFASVLSLNTAGGYIAGCAFSSASLAASGRYVNSWADSDGFTFSCNSEHSFLYRGNNSTGAATLVRMTNCLFDRPIIGLGQHIHTTTKNIQYKNITYYDTSAATLTTFPQSVVVVGSNCDNITVDGIDFGGLTNVHPYTALVSVNAAGCSNIKLRNVGTSPSVRLSLGSANQTGTPIVFATGAAGNTVKMQRVFVSNTRLNLYSGDNSSNKITIENCQGDYADVPINSMLNLTTRGIGATPTYAAQVAVYGTHFFDHFISATVGRIAVLMNEPTALTAAQVALTGGAGFTSAGSLYMPTIGMTATFEMPYFSLGHTGFANSALVMAGGTVGNYTYAYAIDTGAGFGALSANMTAADLGTALNGLGAINPATGFKLRLRITTGTTNATAITSAYVITTTTAVAQENYYPLDLATVTLSGLVTGSDIVILAAGTSTEVLTVDQNVGSTFSGSVDAASYPLIDICIYKQGYVPYTLRNLSLSSTGLSLPINQILDRNFII